ncbi:Exopolyphosphatase [Chytridiales sp. JEL 0842]|nr:Exopolyphosphatase [Chytridiales sp. JEL 0842]
MASRFRSFLKQSKALAQNLSLSTSPSSPVTVVLGNEAADLDSMVSALAYAYLRQTNNTATSTPRSYIPLIPIPSSDFSLRSEAVYAFSSSFPTSSIVPDLVFLDHISLPNLATNHDLKLILTDHNKLPPSLECYANRVDGIIDHHKDEKMHLDAAVRIIEPVGSATSLVVRELVEVKEDSGLLDAELCKLLLAPVLLDTINLQPEMQRVTPTDTFAVERLLAKLVSVSNNEMDLRMAGDTDRRRKSYTDSFFQELQDAKFDCSSLTSLDLLRKDYKETQTASVKFGISTVGWNVQAWKAREEKGLMSIAEALKGWMEKQGLDVGMIMTAFDYKGEGGRGFERELVVCFADKMGSVRQAFLDKLEGVDELQLERVDGPRDRSGLFWYRQKNLGMSRKILQPIVVTICQAML